MGSHLLCRLSLAAAVLVSLSCSTFGPTRTARHPASTEDGDTISDADSLGQGEDLMAAQTRAFDSGLFATSSFSNEAALEAACRSAGPDYEKAFQILQGEQVEVTLAAHEDVRQWVLEGLRNTHETKTSGGTSDGVLRDAVEAVYLGMDYDAYRVISNNVKPKYAYLAPKANSLSADLHPPYTVWSYGEDRYILRLDRIRNRLSLTAGDSLNSLADSIDGQTHRLLSERASSSAQWINHMVPWSRRTLLAPILAQAMGAPTSTKELYTTSHTFGRTLGTRVDWFEDTENNIPGGGAANMGCGIKALSDDHGNHSLKIKFARCTEFDVKAKGFESYCQSCGWSMDYLEAQIWGAITADDIEAFVYTRTEPSEDFKRALAAKGIAVRPAIQGESPASAAAAEGSACIDQKKGVCSTRGECLQPGQGARKFPLSSWKNRFREGSENLTGLYSNKNLNWNADPSCPTTIRGQDGGCCSP